MQNKTFENYNDKISLHLLKYIKCSAPHTMISLLKTKHKNILKASRDMCITYTRTMTLITKYFLLETMEASKSGTTFIEHSMQQQQNTHCFHIPAELLR